jgi:hypothetical protein
MVNRDPLPKIDRIVCDAFISLDGFLAVAYGSIPNDKEYGHVEVYAVLVEDGQGDRTTFNEKYSEIIEDVRDEFDRNPWIFMLKTKRESLEDSLKKWSRRVL